MQFGVNISGKEKGVLPTLYFSPTQTKELLSQVGSTAFIVMQHYVALAKTPNPNLEDKTVASLLGINESTVKTARLSLTKTGWFKKIKKTDSTGTTVLYLIGKEAVKSKYNASINIKREKEK